MIRISGYGDASSATEGILVDNEVALYAICDVQDSLASHAATEGMVLATIRSLLGPLRIETKSSETSARMAVAAVRGAIRHACSTMLRDAIERKEVPTDAASVTLMVVLGDRAIVGHTGTTKLFLLRDGTCKQLTRDRIEEQGASSTRAAGFTDIDVDTFQFEVLSGDRFMMCNGSFFSGCDPLDPIVNALGAAKSVDELPARLMYLSASNSDVGDGACVIVIDAEVTNERADMEPERREEVMLRIDAVRKVFLFKELALDEVLEVAERAILLVPRAGQTIVTEGEEGDAMYVIIEGLCEVSVGGRAVTQLTSGSHFGEMALLSNDPRSGTIYTRERSRMLRISRNDFQEMMRLRPATGVKLLSALGRELSRRLAEETRRHE